MSHHMLSVVTIRHNAGREITRRRPVRKVRSYEMLAMGFEPGSLRLGLTLGMLCSGGDLGLGILFF